MAPSIYRTKIRASRIIQAPCLVDTPLVALFEKDRPELWRGWERRAGCPAGRSLKSARRANAASDASDSSARTEEVSWLTRSSSPSQSLAKKRNHVDRPFMKPSAAYWRKGSSTVSNAAGFCRNGKCELATSAGKMCTVAPGVA